MHARSQNAREPRSGARNRNPDLSCSSKSTSALTCLCRQPTFSVIIWVASTRSSTAIVANRPCPRARGRGDEICKIFLNWGSSEIFKKLSNKILLPLVSILNLVLYNFWDIVSQYYLVSKFWMFPIAGPSPKFEMCSINSFFASDERGRSQIR